MALGADRVRVMRLVLGGAIQRVLMGIGAGNTVVDWRGEVDLGAVVRSEVVGSVRADCGRRWRWRYVPFWRRLFLQIGRRGIAPMKALRIE